MLIRVVRGALPFIVIALISRWLPQGWAVASWAVLLVLQVAIGWRHMRAGNMIAWAGAVLLAIFLVNDSLLGLVWMDRNACFIFYAAFATTGLASLLIGKPFTLAHARLSVPEEFWAHPGFIAINRTVSLVWSLVFLTNAVIAILSRLTPETTSMLCYGLIVVTMIFTDRYPAFARRRMAARAADATRGLGEKAMAA